MFVSAPPSSFHQPSGPQQLLHPNLRIFQALLDLDAFMRFNDSSQNLDLSDRAVECLVSPAFVVVNVFTNDLPVIKVECLLSENAVRIDEAVKNESAP